MTDSKDKTRGEKVAQTNKQLYGEDFYKRIGAKGGKKTHEQGAKLKGFARMQVEDPEKFMEASIKGGSKKRNESPEAR